MIFTVNYQGRNPFLKAEKRLSSETTFTVSQTSYFFPKELTEETLVKFLKSKLIVHNLILAMSFTRRT